MDFYDNEIRKDLIKSLQETGYIIKEEIWINMSRIDVIAIGDCLYGYEIKSDKDNLNRLLQQIKDYSSVFDFIYVIITKKHLDNLNIPEWVGVVLYDGNFTVIKTPCRNFNLDGMSLVRLLWRNELIQCCEEYNLSFKKSWSKYKIQQHLTISLTLEEIRLFVIKCLKRREKGIK